VVREDVAWFLLGVSVVVLFAGLKVARRYTARRPLGDPDPPTPRHGLAGGGDDD
jgi:hypothetical protein